MQNNPNHPLNLDPRHYVPWLVEMGADEVVLDEPLNRFALPLAKVEPATAAPKLAPQQKPPVTNTGNDVSGADLSAAASTVLMLEQALQRFDDHPLKKSATKLCFVSGETTARLLVLCDKPRTEEDPVGEVLAGKHQALAERMLASVGLKAFEQRSAEAVLLANFIPWRPPGNRTVTEQEAKLCLPFVMRLVDIVRPALILCFGALPGQYLAGGDPAIARSRGKWLSLAAAHGPVPMLTTFHPETLLKSPQSKRLAWHDLQSFRARLDNL